MKQIDINYIREGLTERYGINLLSDSFHDRLEFRPVDIEYGVGFIIKIQFEWRSLTAEFIPDTFAAGLIHTMGASDAHQKNIFKMLSEKWLSDKNEIYMEVNSNDVNPLDPDEWDESWSNLYILLTKNLVIPDGIEAEQLNSETLQIAGSLLGLVLALLPLEETVAEDHADGLPEGALTRIEVNRYERSAFNRQACLTFHGYLCAVCGFSFEEKYGKLGERFIHVHHTVPVSELGSNYKINPVKDLVPVCPNCHAMIHKRNPPYTIDELKNIISFNMKAARNGSSSNIGVE